MLELSHYLINYGVLGVWTLTLLIERYAHQKETRQVVSENTKAIKQLKDTLLLKNPRIFN